MRLCTMALIIPKPQFNATLEQALEPLSLLIQGNTIEDSMVLHGVSETLAVVCQVHPMLPHAKFEMVVNSLLKLFSYESSKIPPPACLGLLYLCDGRQEMVVGREYIEPLIHLLIEIVRSFPAFYNKMSCLEGSKPLCMSKCQQWPRKSLEDDIKVSCGRLVPSQHKDSVLEYNEYAFYDPQQVSIRFLVKVKFEEQDVVYEEASPQ
ncbi:hypothetical protein POM88_030924 [Heracleum sosnowskyi]|uniref:PARP catalytic domain-containing protein n=1 Tax=Heracleum sosnowskyi TaxID=360622 RepID=A0AAD8MIM0_9APIA|nr:hypothetical protein POM88_030924 [Heracleum sosnowskyi]